MTVEALPTYLAAHGEAIRAQWLDGPYQPKPVRAAEIPKSGGGVRTLGIPSVLDRVIPQSLLQVLQPIIDPTFSAHSHGVRPGRTAPHAVGEAQRYIQEGKRGVGDVDVEKCFNRVTHDVLRGQVAPRIADMRVLGLIRRYMDAGIMANGVVMERYEGTPQGGPLSPLVANGLLDEGDKARAPRGLAFVRDADDCNVYVRSWRAGRDVMETLTRLYGQLRRRIHEVKSAVARPQDRTCLGYRCWYAKGGAVKRRVAPKARGAMKERVRRITTRNGGRTMPSVCAELRRDLTGWRHDFRLAETPSVFRTVDAWLRHRLRMMPLKPWTRGTTIDREMRRLGASVDAARQVARFSRRWWKNSAKLLHTALPTSSYDRMGVPETCRLPSTTRTAGCGPACPGGVTGKAGDSLPM